MPVICSYILYNTVNTVKILMVELVRYSTWFHMYYVLLNRTNKVFNLILNDSPICYETPYTYMHQILPYYKTYSPIKLSHTVSLNPYAIDSSFTWYSKFCCY